MSFFGKLLIVFQVILSFCFMTFAGAVYTAQLNWKAKAEAASAQAETERSNFNRDKTQWEATRSAMQNEMEKLTSRAKTAEASLSDTNTRLTALQTRLTDEKTLKVSAVAESDLSKQAAASRREEAYRQRSINEKLHETQQDLIEKLRLSEDDRFALVKQMEEMERKHLAALEEIAAYKQLVAARGWVKDIGDFAKSQAPPPEVRGYVTGSRAANNRGTETLVEISLGERDGLVPGHQLYVYRPSPRNDNRGMYLGKIRLVSVTPDKAVGTVIERAKNGIIEKDDHVTTQL